MTDSDKEDQSKSIAGAVATMGVCAVVLVVGVLPQSSLERGVGVIPDCDPGAAIEEGAGDLEADALSAASDYCSLALELILNIH